MKKRNLLIISTEPTPYKIDLYNAIVETDFWHVKVVYVREKDWSPESGHDFKALPSSKFQYILKSGKGVWGKFSQMGTVLRQISKERDLIFICGIIDPTV